MEAIYGRKHAAKQGFDNSMDKFATPVLKGNDAVKQSPPNFS